MLKYLSLENQSERITKLALLGENQAKEMMVLFRYK